MIPPVSIVIANSESDPYSSAQRLLGEACGATPCPAASKDSLFWTLPATPDPLNNRSRSRHSPVITVTGQHTHRAQHQDLNGRTPPTITGSHGGHRQKPVTPLVNTPGVFGVPTLESEEVIGAGDHAMFINTMGQEHRAPQSCAMVTRTMVIAHDLNYSTRAMRCLWSLERSCVYKSRAMRPPCLLQQNLCVYGAR